ncbi:MAG TPA: hypothetical protein VF658_12315 [Pyrinomonadaceae bacterium]|jgi:hypothetical protein
MSETTLAGTVADVFLLAQRGVIIVPDEPWGVSLKAGDTLELRKPDGTFLITRVRGVEMSNPSRLDGKAGILVGEAGLSKDDIPPGTEVFVMNACARRGSNLSESRLPFRFSK